MVGFLSSFLVFLCLANWGLGFRVQGFTRDSGFMPQVLNGFVRGLGFRRLGLKISSAHS